MFDLLEAVGYSASFWCFLLSPGYRQRQVEDFMRVGLAGRLLKSIEGCVAALCGLLPLWVVLWLAP